MSISLPYVEPTISNYVVVANTGRNVVDKFTIEAENFHVEDGNATFWKDGRRIGFYRDVFSIAIKEDKVKDEPAA